MTANQNFRDTNEFSCFFSETNAFHFPPLLDVILVLKLEMVILLLRLLIAVAVAVVTVVATVYGRSAILIICEPNVIYFDIGAVVRVGQCRIHRCYSAIYFLITVGVCLGQQGFLRGRVVVFRF